MTVDRFVWIVIYLNIPLWVAVGILALAFGRWDVARVIVSANAALLFICLVLSFWGITKHMDIN